MHVLLVYECNFLFHLLGRVLLKERSSLYRALSMMNGNS